MFQQNLDLAKLFCAGTFTMLTDDMLDVCCLDSDGINQLTPTFLCSFSTPYPLWKVRSPFFPLHRGGLKTNFTLSLVNSALSVFLSVHSVPPDQQQGQCGHQSQRACPHSFSGTLSACLNACLSVCMTVCLLVSFFNYLSLQWHLSWLGSSVFFNCFFFLLFLSSLKDKFIILEPRP